MIRQFFSNSFKPAAVVLTLLMTGPFAPMTATAQSAQSQSDDIAWVQIEAQPSLNDAQEAIRGYAGRLADVNGFSLGQGWYAIVLGPYTRDDAAQVLRVYRREGQIPRDSFITFTNSFRQQFWPVGTDFLTNPPRNDAAPADQTADQPADQTAEAAAVTEPAAQAVAGDTPAEQPAAAPQPPAPDETKSEALRGERDLDRAARMDLQSMLKWAGNYDSGIDGAFGRGTRASMAAWQEANGFEVTGVMTTLQRATLLKQYNAILDGMGLRMVRDEGAGIEMALPMGVVDFDRYEPPFGHYTAKGDLDVQVLTISQQGDQATLWGLYDIMQTLEIVPPSGPRERKNDSFVLIGEDGHIVSHTEAYLRAGQVKGFTLVWPVGDEERRRRVLSEMQTSFSTFGAALDPAAGDNGAQSIDLLSGLEIRKPKLARSGFYIDAKGTVVTTAEAVAQCGRITLDDDIDATVIASDAENGIAILRPQEPLAPMSTARFQRAVPRLQSDVAVSGYSFEGVLNGPTLTYGTLADIRGLRGETGLKRLALNAMPGDAGGPVFDAGGAVLGMLLPATNGAQKLPDGVSFVADGSAVLALLQREGISAETTDALGTLDPVDLTASASSMTVLVSCWE